MTIDHDAIAAKVRCDLTLGLNMCAAYLDLYDERDATFALMLARAEKAESGRRDMHRRAQKAEGALCRTRSVLKLFEDWLHLSHATPTIHEARRLVGLAREAVKGQSHRLWLMQFCYNYAVQKHHEARVKNAAFWDDWNKKYKTLEEGAKDLAAQAYEANKRAEKAEAERDALRAHPYLPAEEIAAVESGNRRWHGEYDTTVSVRWEPYKPDGQRQMKAKGRWQTMTHNGSGYFRWENCDRPAQARQALKGQTND